MELFAVTQYMPGGKHGKKTAALLVFACTQGEYPGSEGKVKHSIHKSRMIRDVQSRYAISGSALRIDHH